MFKIFRKNPKFVAALAEGRVPPGQYLTAKFPVLQYGSVPCYRDLKQTWDLRVWGEIAAPAQLAFAAFRAVSTTEVVGLIHCVTRWSKLDTRWEGVPFAAFLDTIPPLHPAAHYVLAHCDGGYTTSIPLEILLEDDALLAYKYEGE